jgi:hypothetical protein
MGKIQGFYMLLPMVHIITIGLQAVNFYVE